MLNGITKRSKLNVFWSLEKPLPQSVYRGGLKSLWQQNQGPPKWAVPLRTSVLCGVSLSSSHSLSGSTLNLSVLLLLDCVVSLPPSFSSLSPLSPPFFSSLYFLCLSHLTSYYEYLKFRGFMVSVLNF